MGFTWTCTRFWTKVHPYENHKLSSMKLLLLACNRSLLDSKRIWMGKDTPQYGFILPSQHLLPDWKNKTWLLQQLRHPLWLYTLIKPTRPLLLPKAAETIWLIWLLHMKPCKIMVLILKLCFLPPFLPFIRLYLWQWSWTRYPWCKNRRWPCW